MLKLGLVAVPPHEIYWVLIGLLNVIIQNLVNNGKFVNWNLSGIRAEQSLKRVAIPNYFVQASLRKYTGIVIKMIGDCAGLPVSTNNKNVSLLFAQAVDEGGHVLIAVVEQNIGAYFEGSIKQSVTRGVNVRQVKDALK